MAARELRFFISAAEPSADRHAADLIRAVRAARPGCTFAGVAGPRMVEAGCEQLFDMTSHSAMLLGAVRLIGRARRMMRICRERLEGERWDGVVVVDSPALHLRLAAMARRIGVPVLYYIAPQLWAWGQKRIEKVRRDVDRLAVILPFEEEWFRSRGVEATFVGHPLGEQFEKQAVDGRTVERLRAGGRPFVAMLPGSRAHVVGEVLPGQLEVAERIAAAHPEAAFGVSVANERAAAIIRPAIEQKRHLRVVEKPGYAELIEAADLVLVASGTSTLEVAIRGTPMVVMYNTSRLMYHLFVRWVVRSEHLSLPNILAGRRIVPEFMPYFRSTEPIAEAALQILADQSVRERMLADLGSIAKPLIGRSASAETCAMLLELAEGARSRATGSGLAV